MVVRQALEHAQSRAKGSARSRRQRLAGKLSHLSAVLDCLLTWLPSTHACALTKILRRIPGLSDT